MQQPLMRCSTCPPTLVIRRSQPYEVPGGTCSMKKEFAVEMILHILTRCLTSQSQLLMYLPSVNLQFNSLSKITLKEGCNKEWGQY